MKIKVLSWNIWCGTHLEKVIDFLKKADADIIALQEVSDDERGNLAEIISKKLGYNYTHAVGMNLPSKFLPRNKCNDTRTTKFGNAVLSKYPITNGKIIELTKEDKRLIVEADIKIKNKTIHIFSVHLKHTHQKQSALQDSQIKNLIKLSHKKETIVMGDFNALPQSSVIKKISIKLKNTDGKLAIPTWSVYKEGCSVCSIENMKHKLDYIFTSNDIKVSSFQVHKSKSSDHLPISAVIEI